MSREKFINHSTISLRLKILGSAMNMRLKKWTPKAFQRAVIKCRARWEEKRELSQTFLGFLNGSVKSIQTSWLIFMKENALHLLRLNSLINLEHLGEGKICTQMLEWKKERRHPRPCGSSWQMTRNASSLACDKSKGWRGSTKESLWNSEVSNLLPGKFSISFASPTYRDQSGERTVT